MNKSEKVINSVSENSCDGCNMKNNENNNLEMLKKEYDSCNMKTSEKTIN